MSAGDIAAIVTAVVAVIALCGGYAQFVLKRSGLGYVEFDVEFTEHHVGQAHLIGELACVIRNVRDASLGSDPVLEFVSRERAAPAESLQSQESQSEATRLLRSWGFSWASSELPPSSTSCKRFQPSALTVRHDESPPCGNPTHGAAPFPSVLALDLEDVSDPSDQIDPPCTTPTTTMAFSRLGSPVLTSSDRPRTARVGNPQSLNAESDLLRWFFPDRQEGRRRITRGRWRWSLSSMHATSGNAWSSFAK